VAHTAGGDRQLDFRFLDVDNDGTLSVPGGPPNGDYFDVFTYARTSPAVPRSTWRVFIDPASATPVRPPAAGDVFRLRLIVPFGADDAFVFNSTGQRIDSGLAQREFRQTPYVVPNPYVGSASFEPERFAVSGRGERRLEFRSLPRDCVIRIYTVRGDLVQTLEHDGSNDGFVAWNLRTKDNLDVAPGLYIFHVDGGPLGTHTGKFAIIK
jgi:hypothetical protein